MSSTMIKALGTVLGAGLIALGHSGLIPVIPSEVFSVLAALIFGALHIPQPGTAKALRDA